MLHSCISCLVKCVICVFLPDAANVSAQLWGPFVWHVRSWRAWAKQGCACCCGLRRGTGTQSNWQTKQFLAKQNRQKCLNHVDMIWSDLTYFRSFWNILTDVIYCDACWHSYRCRRSTVFFSGHTSTVFCTDFLVFCELFYAIHQILLNACICVFLSLVSW